MKLRNKKTGEIIEWENDLSYKLDKPYKTLKEFLENYEDAPEVSKTWAEEVAVRELPSGLKIADIDYYEINEAGEKKTKFTWDEAMERFKDDPNWRLPTPKELNQMVLDLGYNDEGVFKGELFAKNLGHEGEDFGYYGSSADYSSISSSVLYFYPTGINLQYDRLKSCGLAIRCVRREKDGTL